MTQIAQIAPTEEQRRAAWLARRREFITSSDVPAIMGLPGAYGSPMQVFLEKKNLLEKGKEPTWLEAGLRLQPVILNWYADRRGVPLEHVDPYDLVVAKDHPFLAASLDGRWYDLSLRRPTICVDAKNVRHASADDWGEEGTDQIPGRYVVQLHVQMLATGETSFAELAALFGGADPRWFRVDYDEEIAAGVVEAAERFMREHVVADVPPEVDASEDWTRWLNSRPVRGDYKEAPPEIIAKRAEALKLAGEMAALEERATLLKNEVRSFIGDAPGMWFAGPDGKPVKVHYKRNKDGTEVDWEAIARAAGASESLIKEHTTSKPGARPLLLGKDK